MRWGVGTNWAISQAGTFCFFGRCYTAWDKGVHSDFPERTDCQRHSPGNPIHRSDHKRQDRGLFRSIGRKGYPSQRAVGWRMLWYLQSPDPVRTGDCAQMQRGNGNPLYSQSRTAGSHGCKWHTCPSLCCGLQWENPISLEADRATHHAVLPGACHRLSPCP